MGAMGVREASRRGFWERQQWPPPLPLLTGQFVASAHAPQYSRPV